MQVNSAEELESDLAKLARDGFCADVRAIARDAVQLLTPPENISTTECAEKHRYMRLPKGNGKRLWSRDLTPYIVPIQDALDDPRYPNVAVIKPGRVGGTVAGENHAFKRMRFGPQGDIGFYLPGDAFVESYADREFRDLFELHPEIKSKLGRSASDNKRTYKKVGGRDVGLFPANMKTTAGKQFAFLMADEVDSYPPNLRDSFTEQADVRGAVLGLDRKSYLLSHPDRGWGGGIGAIYRLSTRGVWYWPCPHCGGFSSPSPWAASHMKLHFTRPERMPEKELLAHVAATAGMLCPHCGTVIDEKDRPAMLGAGFYVFDGQVISIDGKVGGDIIESDTAGFAIHGTMSPFNRWGDLAKRYVAATLFFERTGKADKLKTFLSRALGIPGDKIDNANRGLDADALKRRAAEPGDTAEFRQGTVPKGVRFLTAWADTQGKRWEAGVIGWSEAGEAWYIDRFAISERNGRGVRPAFQQDDWDVLRTKLLERVYPLADRPGWGLPIAVMGYDTGGEPGVTPRAREFARRMLAKLGPSNAYRIRPTKGAARKTADEIPLRPREVNRTDDGKPMSPSVWEYDIGVHKLKDACAEMLATEVPGPGFLHLPVDMDPAHIDELAAETKNDDDWVRNGANESWDILVACEALRQMLKPDRPQIRWDDAPPPWARPIRIAPAVADEPAETPKAAAPKRRKDNPIARRLAAMNKR